MFYGHFLKCALSQSNCNHNLHSKPDYHVMFQLVIPVDNWTICGNLYRQDCCESDFCESFHIADLRIGI